MAANTKINYTVGINADTKQAKAQMQELMDSISKISKQASLSYDTKSIKEGIAAAKELERHLQKAFNVSTGNLDLSKLNASLRATGTTLDQLASRMQQFGVSGQAAFSQLASSITSAQVPLKRTTAMVDNLMINLKKTAQWQFSSTIIHGLVGQIQSAIGYVRNLNGALTDIAIVSDLSSSQLAKFAADAQKLGKSLSASTLDVSRAALIYFQQGDSVLKSMEKAAITIKAANASANSSAAEMSEYLTAIWNSYKVGSQELEKYVDMMAALGAKTASSMEEIATAMQKVAATANTVGVGFDQMSSIISTVSSVTRESAESIGTSYKTILARIGDLKLGNLVEDGVTVTLGSVSKELQKIGVNVLDVRGNMRDMGLIIEEIGTKWQAMNDAQKTATAQVIAGKRQYTQLMALFENWDTYQNNIVIANDSEGALNKMQETWATGWEAASNRVRNSLEGMYSSIIDDKFVTDMLNVFAEMISGIDLVIDKMGGLGTVATLVGSVMVSKLGNRTHEIFDTLKSNLGLMTGSTQRDMVKLNEQLAESQRLISSAKKDALGTNSQRALRGETIGTTARYRAAYLQNQDYLSEEARSRYTIAEQRYAEVMKQREENAKQNRQNRQAWDNQKKSRQNQFADSSLVHNTPTENTQLTEAVAQKQAEMKQSQKAARDLQYQKAEAARELATLQASQQAVQNEVAEKQADYDQKNTAYTHTAPQHAEDKARHKKNADQAAADLQSAKARQAAVNVEVAAKQKQLRELEEEAALATDLSNLAEQEYQSMVETQQGARQDAAATMIPEEFKKYRDQLEAELGANDPIVVDLTKFIELKAGDASQEEVSAAAAKLNDTVEQEFFKASRKRSKIASDGGSLDFNDFYGLDNVQQNLKSLKTQDLNTEEIANVLAEQKKAIKDSLANGADGDEAILELGLKIDSAESIEELEAKLEEIKTALAQEQAKAEAVMEAAKKTKKEFGASDEDIQQMEDEANRRNVEGAQEQELKEQSEGLQQDMKDATKPVVELSDALGAVAGGLGSIVAGAAAVQGAITTMCDPEATGLEKLTASITGVIAVLNALNGITSAMKTLSLFGDATNLGLTIANTKATEDNAKAKMEAAFAAMRRGEALDKESIDLLENTAMNKLKSKSGGKGKSLLSKDGLSGAWQGIKNLGSSLKNGIVSIFRTIGTGITKALSAVFKGLGSKLAGAAGVALKGLAAKIAGAGAAVVGGVATAIVAAIVAAIVLWNKHLDKIDKDLAERQEALNGALNTQAQQQQTLQNDLVALSAVMQKTSLSYDEQLTKINEICAAYGVQATMLDVLSGNYVRLEASMRNAAVAQNNANSYLANENLSAAEQIVADRRAQLTGMFQHKNRVLFDETNDVVKKGNARASLLNDTAWTAHGWNNDGNVRGIMNGGYLSGEAGKQHFSAEGHAWLQIADKLEEAGFRFNQATASLEEITPGQGNGALLAQMIQDDASLSQYINSNGSYTKAIFDELQTVGYVDLARAQRQQQQSVIMGQLLKDRNFDFLGSSNSTYTLDDVQKLISSSLGNGEYKTGANQAFLASYLASFSQYADAANQYLAVSELANTVLSINPSVKVDSAAVTESLLNLLDDEFTIDALLKINPTDVMITSEGQAIISNAVKQYAMDLAEKDAITKRRDTIAANKDLLTKDVYTYDDYALLKETNLFKDDADITRFMSQSADSRLREITLMEQEAVDDLIKNAEDIIKSGKNVQIETNKSLGEFYNSLAVNTKAQWNALSEDVQNEIAGKSGVELFTSLNNWQGTYAQLASSAATAIDTWTALGVSDTKTWNSIDTTQKQDVISQLASIGITSIDGRALTTASSYEDVAKAIELAKTKQYEFISQSDTLNALIHEGVELQSNYATKQAEIAAAEGDLEKAEWWRAVGQEIDKATKAADAYVSVLQKGYKDVTSEDFNQLLLYDPDVFAKYAQGAESWQDYIYEKSLEWYEQQMALYNKAGDTAAFQQAMNERNKLIAEHNDNLLQETKAAGESMEEINQSIEKNISDANSFLSSLTEKGSFSAMSFESISKFRANLLELGYTAKEVDTILKNLGKDQNMTDSETALAAAQMQLDLLLTGAAQQQKQYDAYINFHTEVVGGQVSDVLDFSNNALGLRTKDSSADVSIEMGDTPDILDPGKDGVSVKVGTSKNVGVGLDTSGIGTAIAGTGTITTDDYGKIIAQVGEKSTEFTFGVDPEGMTIDDPKKYSLTKSTSGGYQLLVTGANGKTWVFDVNADALQQWSTWGGGTIEKTTSGYGLKFTDQTGKEWTIGISDDTAENFLETANSNGINYDKDKGFYITVPDGEQTYTFKLGISLFPEMENSNLFTEEGLLQFINQNGEQVTIDPATHEFTARYNVNGELNYGFKTAGSEEKWSWLNAAQLSSEENTLLTAWLRGVKWSMDIELTAKIAQNSILQQVFDSSKKPIPVTVDITYNELNEPEYWQTPGVGGAQITDTEGGPTQKQITDYAGIYDPTAEVHARLNAGVRGKGYDTYFDTYEKERHTPMLDAQLSDVIDFIDSETDGFYESGTSSHYQSATSYTSTVIDLAREVQFDNRGLYDETARDNIVTSLLNYASAFGRGFLRDEIQQFEPGHTHNLKGRDTLIEKAYAMAGMYYTPQMSDTFKVTIDFQDGNEPYGLDDLWQREDLWKTKNAEGKEVITQTFAYDIQTVMDQTYGNPDTMIGQTYNNLGANTMAEFALADGIEGWSEEEIANAEAFITEYWNTLMADIQENGLTESNITGMWLAAGLINGFTSTVDSSAISDSLLHLIQVMNITLGISSPSKVTMKMGYWLAEGLNVGLKNAKIKADGFGKKVLDAIKADVEKTISDNDFATILSDYQITAPGGASPFETYMETKTDEHGNNSYTVSWVGDETPKDEAGWTKNEDNTYSKTFSNDANYLEWLTSTEGQSWNQQAWNKRAENAQTGLANMGYTTTYNELEQGYEVVINGMTRILKTSEDWVQAYADAGEEYVTTQKMREYYRNKEFLNLDNNNNNTDITSNIMALVYENAMKNWKNTHDGQEFDFELASAEDILAFTGYMESAYEQMGVSLLENTDLTWSQISDVIFGYIDSQVAAEAAAAEEIYKTWSETFQAIAEARKILLEGGNVGLEASEETKQRLITNWLNEHNGQPINLNEFHSQLYGNDATLTHYSFNSEELLSSIAENGNAQYLNYTNGLLDPAQSVYSYTEKKRTDLAGEAETYIPQVLTHLETSLNAWDYMYNKTQETVTRDKYESDEEYQDALNATTRAAFLEYMRGLTNDKGEQIYSTEKYSDEQLMRYVAEATTYQNTMAWESGHYDSGTETWVDGSFDVDKLSDEYVNAHLGTPDELQKEFNAAIVSVWGDIDKYRMSLYKDAQTQRETTISQKTEDLELVQKALNGEDLTAVEQMTLDTILNVGESLSDAEDRLASEIDAAADDFSLIEQAIQAGYLKDANGDWVKTETKLLDHTYQTKEDAEAQAAALNEQGTHGTVTVAEVMTDEGKTQYVLASSIVTSNLGGEITEGEGGLYSTVPEEEKLTSTEATWDKYAARAGMAVEEFKTYANVLNETLADPFKDQKELAKYAQQMIVIEEGYQELADVSSDTWKILKDDSQKGTKTYATSLANMTKSVKKIFNNNKHVTADFVKDHLADIEKMAEGDEEAFERISDALIKSSLGDDFDKKFEITVDIDQDGVTDTLGQIIDNYETQLANANIEISEGMVITPEIETSGVTAGLLEILNAGGETAAGVQAALAAIGWVPEVAYDEFEVQSQEDINGTVVYHYVDANGNEQTYTGGSAGYNSATNTIRVPRIGDKGQTQYSGLRNIGGGHTPPPSGGGGGGGGNKKPPKPTDLLKRSDETERYRDISEELARTSEQLEKIDKLKSRAFGKNYLKQLEAETEALQDQREEQERYIQEIKDWAVKDQQALVDLNVGAEFDEENSLSNYDEVMENLMNRMDGWTEEYDRRKLEIFNSNMSDEEKEAANEELEDWYKDREEEYDDAKEAIDQYSDTLALLGDEEANLLDIENQIMDNNLEAITYKMELDIEINEGDLKILEYYQGIFEKDLETQDDLMRNLMTQAQEYESNLGTLNTAMEELHTKLANGEITEEGFATSMQELTSQAIDQAQSLEDLKDTFVQVYEEALSMADEQVKEFTDTLDHANTMIETFISLQALMGKGTDYKKLTQLYTAQYETNLNRVKAQREYVDTLAAEMAKYEAKESLTETEEKQYKALQKTYQEANETLMSTTEEALQGVQAAYENSINDIFKTLSLNIAGTGQSLEELADSYTYYQETQERYVSTAKELYEISKLNRSIDQSLQDATTKASKEKLKALQAEIEAISEKNDLTEYDIEMMNLQYKLTLAQIALEEAQASKDTVRLVRDENGGLAYQYTANQEKVHEAQQQYEDVLQEINDLAANRVSELEQQCLEAEQQYLSAAQEILLDTTLTDEERTRKLEELSQRYSETLLYIQEQYNTASSHLSSNQAAVAEHYGQSLVNAAGEASTQMNSVIANMIAGAQEHIELFNEAITGDSADAWNEYLERISSITDGAGLSYEDLTNRSKEYADATEELLEAVQKLVETITATFADITVATEQWDDHLAVLEQVQEAYENMAISAQNAVKMASELDSDALKEYAATWTAGWTVNAETMEDATSKYIDTLTESQASYSKAIDTATDVLAEYDNIIATLHAELAAALDAGIAAGSVPGSTTTTNHITQNVEVRAEFPNATDTATIREAVEEIFMDFGNLATQAAYS